MRNVNRLTHREALAMKGLYIWHSTSTPEMITTV